MEKLNCLDKVGTQFKARLPLIFYTGILLCLWLCELASCEVVKAVSQMWFSDESRFDS